jgi:hypothetical protein
MGGASKIPDKPPFERWNPEPNPVEKADYVSEKAKNQIEPGQAPYLYKTYPLSKDNELKEKLRKKARYDVAAGDTYNSKFWNQYNPYFQAGDTTPLEYNLVESAKKILNIDQGETKKRDAILGTEREMKSALEVFGMPYATKPIEQVFGNLESPNKLGRDFSPPAIPDNLKNK